jgi:hypothetical protein
MSSTKAIIGFQKQNDGMYSSLLARNIPFERTIIPENILEQDHLKLLQEENMMLKELTNANKTQQPKKEKKKSDSISQTTPKESKESKQLDNKKENEEEEKFENPVKKFDTITNMEELKKAFFNGDYTLFEDMVKTNKLKFYNVEYKYNDDKDGSPDYSAKNLLKGFVRSFDDYRKYFMICFRCWKNQNNITYKYNSLWIVNTPEPLPNIIGSLYDDFNFVEITNIDDIDIFIQQIKKLPELDSDEPVFINGYTCIGESFVH